MKLRRRSFTSLSSIGLYGVVIERGGIVRKIRKLIYRMGFRPKSGSIFCSPSMAVFYTYKDAIEKEK